MSTPRPTAPPSDAPDPIRLRRDLERWLFDANDARRRVGQALYHFYRTLVFWNRRGLGFGRITTLWAPAAAEILSELGRALERQGLAGRDDALRAFAAGFLERLAEDLGRGDRALPLFLSWMETRFPRLTALMRESDPQAALHDPPLLGTLATGLARASRLADRALGESLLRTAQDLRA